MSSTALIRPAWTPATIALTVVGFMVFWPLGLAMLAFILWGDRLPAFRRGWIGNGPWASKRWERGIRRSFDRTGNAAFDEWRENELKRLAEERSRLESVREEFDAYAAELRRAKDQEEFDRFMSRRDRSNKSNAGTSSDKPLNGDLLPG